MKTPSPVPTLDPVDRYLALTVRLLAMGENDARREALEGRMDEAWKSLSSDQIDEANMLMAHVSARPEVPEFTTGDADLDALLAATVGLTDSPNQDSGMDWLNCLEKVKGRLALPAAAVLDLKSLDASSVGLIGKAFRAVLSNPQVGWRKKDDSSFVPLVVERLSRAPELEPSDEAHGQAFLEVLRDPAYAWRQTPAAPFISKVVQVASELSLFPADPRVDFVDRKQWALVPKHITGGMRSALAQVEVMDCYQKAFEAVLDEVPSPPSDAEALGGWVWVPRRITTAMWKAWEQSTMVSVDEQEDYDALLGAAPTLPAEVRARFDRFHLAGPEPVFPSSRVLVERGFLGVKHFDTEEAHARWRSLPWWRRLFS